MILLKATGQIFRDRKEAKQILGHYYYSKLLKKGDQLQHIDNDNCIALYEIQEDNDKSGRLS